MSDDPNIPIPSTSTAVRCRFMVMSKTRSDGGISVDCKRKVLNSVVLKPVYGGSPDNQRFFAASPSGEIQLNILNQPAADAFEVGREYYVEFTPVG